ncbi:MAG: DUF262 domain-containing protein [Lachnospiraceae bacterium]|nr:DUF262 domain-containing protein [Lachnospiraceae bacterium]
MNNDDRSNKTFWQLVKERNIIIPSLQRDYAQGRINNAIEQIRTGLIDSIYDSLTNNTPLVLNFIYGERNDDEFIPIDGQQRLTTLFLLHWYIFSRAKSNEELTTLKRFSYKTRDTSKRFCEKLCDSIINFESKITISNQIINNPWFTGNFSYDPTINSMLVVIDCIHSKFSGLADYSNINSLLISENCPISFLWLPMDDFQKTDDLYIKMNARGKLLTDFEIFKAKLQGSSILKDILGTSSDEKQQILYISKFNNLYSEFFYQLFGDRFDYALMNFIKEIIKNDYFCYVSMCGVPQKDYRDDYKKISDMNGSVFYRFIEKDGFNYKQLDSTSVKNIIISSIHKMSRLLEIFSAKKDIHIELNISKSYYNENDLIKNIIQSNLERNVIRFAVYEFLNKFDFPHNEIETQAYSMWMRFIYNIMTNSDLGGRSEDTCEAIVFFKTIIESIPVYTEKAVLDAIISPNGIKVPAALRYQYDEEIVKAKLIDFNSEWREYILNAEHYFVDGQIGYLLLFCIVDKHYNLDKFKFYLSTSCKFFDSKKNIIDTCNNTLFKQALLCMKDCTNNSTSFLEKQSNSNTTWGFYGSNYSDLLSNKAILEKKMIIKNLFDSIDLKIDTNVALEQLIKNVDLKDFSGNDLWKIIFIQNTLFNIPIGSYFFKNCIHLADSNKSVLLLAGTTARAYSMEPHTYLLFEKLKKLSISNLYLKCSTTSQLLDSESFPLRYIEYKNIQIGYMCDNSLTPYVIKENNTITKYALADILTKVTAY